LRISDLVKIAKNLKSGKSGGGGLVQLEGNVIYMTNSKHSIALKIYSYGLFETPEHIGTGTLHTNDLEDVDRIERRDGKVLIGERMIPEKPSFSDKVEEVMNKYYKEPNIPIGKALFKNLEDQLVVRLIGEGDKIKISQLGIERWISVNGVEAKGDVTVYTSDLKFLELFNNIKITLTQPMCFEATYNLDKVTGLIAHLVYER